MLHYVPRYMVKRGSRPSQRAITTLKGQLYIEEHI